MLAGTLSDRMLRWTYVMIHVNSVWKKIGIIITRRKSLALQIQHPIHKINIPWCIEPLMNLRANGHRLGLWRQLLLNGKVGFLKLPYCVKEDTEESIVGVADPEVRRWLASPFNDGTRETTITPEFE